MHLHTRMRRLGFGNMDVWSGLRLCARLRGSDVGIGSRLDRKWRKLRRRPERLRRQHRFRKIEAEEVAGPVLVCDRRTAPRQQHRANCGGEKTLQDHLKALPYNHNWNNTLM